jgi:hypothetical protein
MPGPSSSVPSTVKCWLDMSLRRVALATTPAMNWWATSCSSNRSRFSVKLVAVKGRLRDVHVAEPLEA